MTLPSIDTIGCTPLLWVVTMILTSIDSNIFPLITDTLLHKTKAVLFTSTPPLSLHLKLKQILFIFGSAFYSTISFLTLIHPSNTICHLVLDFIPTHIVLHTHCTLEYSLSPLVAHSSQYPSAKDYHSLSD